MSEIDPSEVRVRGTVSTVKDKNDRRGSDRFPIEREVKYKILSKKHGEEMGNGKTVNMSSNGVLFTTDQLLVPGRRLELNISWPAQLNAKVALKLVARGRIVRYEEGRAAMEIQQYEFRTQASQTSQATAKVQ
jgi:PilZ domain